MVSSHISLVTSESYKPDWLDRSLKTVLILLIASCMFDPADKLLSLKVPFFILAWMLFMLGVIVRKGMVYVSLRATIYLVLFVFVIPLTSIFYYLVINGDTNYFDGYLYFKPYLFLTIVPILYSSKIDILKPTIMQINILSFATLALLAIGFFNVSLFTYFVEIGSDNDITRIGTRNFGDTYFPMVYFESSPLIVFAIGYFAKMFNNSKGSKRILIGGLLLINMIAMFVGATRNNMIISILAPLVILYWYAKRKTLIVMIAFVFLAWLVISNFSIIQSMFDSKENSNELKLSFLGEYLRLFSNWDILLFGQGLGSYFNSSTRGYVSNSELTYLELIRRFGAILSIFIFSMLLYPLSKLRLKRFHNEHYLFLSYFFYLIMSFSNPLLLSSTGMLLLSLVLVKTFSPVPTFKTSIK